MDSQHQSVEIALDDHVLHALHSLVEQVGIGGVGVVHVGLLVGAAHDILEFLCEEFLASLDISFVAGEIGERVPDWRTAGHDLFAEDVDLVEEEDEGGTLKVFAVGDALEQHKRFVHLVLVSACQRELWTNGSG